MDDFTPDNSTSHTDLNASGAQTGHIRLAQIDHEEYDALADLFLGDGGFAPARISDHQSSRVEDQDPSLQTTPQGSVADVKTPADDLPNHTTHTPVLQLTQYDEDAQVGYDAHDDEYEPETAGMRILETIRATDAHASDLLAQIMGEQTLTNGSDVELCDELDDGYREINFASMLNPKKPAIEDAKGRKAVAHSGMPIEVIVLGHLPVRATLWARQYACSLAREQDETVALIRAASGSTSIDLITGHDAPSVSASAQLDGAFDTVSTQADRVILRVEGTWEPELLDRHEVDQITILTGADEAAIVASYRLIKTLDATLSARDTKAPAPMLRLAIMGAHTDVAQDACEKLQNAVKTFIKRPIEIVVGSGRIDATGTTNLYRDSVAHRASEIFQGLVDASTRRQGVEPHPAIESDHQVADETSVPHESPPEASEASELRVEFPTTPVVIPSTRTPNTARSPRPVESDAPTIRDGLCALVPGLRPIESRCPKAIGVEMAIDDDGHVHLLVSDMDTSDAMNRLLAAQSWVRDNLGLLLRAEPMMTMPTSARDEDTDAKMHLISANPRSVHEIYDTPVRVYALARVKIGNIIAQVATPIN